LPDHECRGNLALYHLKALNLKPSSFPFAYALRVSPRARQLRVVIKPFVGLEVVIPKNFPRKQIPRILQQHEGWITKQLNKHAHTFTASALPETIKLSLTAESIPVVYKKLSDTNANPTWQMQQGELLLSHHQHEDAIQLLRHWLRSKAKQELPPRLRATAAKYGFSYARASIRSQKSRWGSCSSRGTISLNDQLMFIPEDTVDYLLIHELCHTRHMNHSVRFWQLVESCCTDFRRHEQVLGDVQHWVPQWFSRSLLQ
jgi:predicted metal-dependent hydrolase